jgi:uncharacterized membrane protein
VKIINYILIGITAIGIFLLSFFFYIGSLEQFIELKSNYPLGFVIGRTLFFAIPSVILFLALFFLNKTNSRINHLKIGLTGIIICIISSLIGTLMFLN